MFNPFFIFCFNHLLAFALPEPVRIMPIGDSITQGGKRGVAEHTYRLPLQMLLHQHGIAFDFMGSRQAGLHPEVVWPAIADSVPFDPDHFGYYGWRTRSVCDSVKTHYNPAWQPPHIVLVHLGTNDQKHGDFEAHVGLPLRQLIAFLREKNPKVTVLLGHLNFNNGKEAFQIREVVEKVAADLDSYESAVRTVHHYRGWLENPEHPYTNTFNWAHPNLKGQEKMARNWWQAMQPFLFR